MTDSLARVLEPDGWALLNSLPPYDPDRAMRLAEELRARGLNPDLVAAALTQSRLRAKARAKFGDFADGMALTEAGIEQATRLPVAALHAERYRRAGLIRVADLTCGLGADAMTMAALGLDVVAIEADAATAAAATVNLRFFPEVRVIHADCLTVDLDALGVEALFADPGRRTAAGRRIFDPHSYSPPIDALLRLGERFPLGLKVAPGLAHADVPSGAEAQWVSVDRNVVECGLWFGPLRDSAALATGSSSMNGHTADHRTTNDDRAEDSATSGATDGASRPASGGTTSVDAAAGASPSADGVLRTAVVIRGRRAVTVRATVPDDPDVGELGQYVYEPDGAVIRAHLVSEVAAATGGRLVHPAIAYVTSDRLVPLPFADAYRVLDSMPFSLKRLKAYLRERHVGRATIKKRGTAIVPEHLRTQLALKGDQEATLILTRLGERQSVIVAEPIIAEEGP